jgi:hypothetical protein
MLRHPVQGVERVRGRLDRRGDQRAWQASVMTPRELYGVGDDWDARLHEALGQPWPCDAAAGFDDVWGEIRASFDSAGVRLGLASYGGWNDGDAAFSRAVWCTVAHLRPRVVVETGVAHGVTSRVILGALALHGEGRLWSVDLPAVDPALHSEIGVAVPEALRRSWTYVAGTSRQRLPGLVAELGAVDVFVHDSLHTGRNVAFELDTVWPALRTNGVAIVDDIDHSLGLHGFLTTANAWCIAAEHEDGTGLWGAVMKQRAAL